MSFKNMFMFVTLTVFLGGDTTFCAVVYPAMDPITILFINWLVNDKLTKSLQRKEMNARAIWMAKIINRVITVNIEIRIIQHKYTPTENIMYCICYN